VFGGDGWVGAIAGEGVREEREESEWDIREGNGDDDVV
jgi:hypothetical protein